MIYTNEDSAYYWCHSQLFPYTQMSPSPLNTRIPINQYTLRMYTLRWTQMYNNSLTNLIYYWSSYFTLVICACVNKSYYLIISTQLFQYFFLLIRWKFFKLGSKTIKCYLMVYYNCKQLIDKDVHTGNWFYWYRISFL